MFDHHASSLVATLEHRLDKTFAIDSIWNRLFPVYDLLLLCGAVYIKSTAAGHRHFIHDILIAVAIIPFWCVRNRLKIELKIWNIFYTTEQEFETYWCLHGIPTDLKHNLYFFYDKNWNLVYIIKQVFSLDNMWYLDPYIFET